MDLFDLAIYRALNKGGGGGGVTVEPITITENGTTAAPTGKAYTPVNVNVPNSYSAGDEGKVVSNGALVAQTAHAEVTSNGTIDTTLNNSVTINVSGGGGGGSVAANAVNFRDYDGTIVASYSASDFANLTALPANPSHDGLTAQGWNWSLADAKTYVASYGKLNVGQMYITTDGKTHVHIHLDQGRTSPMLGVCPNGTVDVDWGDGTTHDTLTGTSTTLVQWTSNHSYAAPGDYVIKLTVSEGGSMGIIGDSGGNAYSTILRYTSSGDPRNNAYRNSIISVSIGNGVSQIGDSCFRGCANLQTITLPSSVIGISGNDCFNSCYSLKSVTIPSGIDKIKGGMFNNCYTLSSLIMPNSITMLESNSMYNCYCLKGITMPSGITAFGSGCFRQCYSLTSIIIPSGITSIESYTLYNDYSLAELHFKPSSPPIVSNSNAFSNIQYDCKIYVPYSADHSILSAYTSASNYPSSSTYTYVEE